MQPAPVIISHKVHYVDERIAVELSAGPVTGKATMHGDAATADAVERAAALLHGRCLFARHPSLQPDGVLALDPLTRTAVGLLESARLQAVCAERQVSIATWLGGPLRPRSAVAVEQQLGAPLAWHKQVVLTSMDTDVGRLIEQLRAAAEELGPDAGLVLRLNGGLAPAGIEALRVAGRELRLGYIADPADTLAAATRCFAHSAPPLALTAHRYDLKELARCMRDGAVQVLLVDPVRVGGPDAVRMLSRAAELTGVELALIAPDDTADAQAYVAEIASTLASHTQPMIGCSSEIAPRAPTSGPTVKRITLHHVQARMRQLYVSAMYMRRTTERVIVEIETSDGQRGFGETNGTEDVVQSLTRMARKALGQSPLDRLRLRQTMAGSMIGSRNGLADWQALAGMDMALFDWAGRHHGLPIWRMLGGEGRSSFEAVAHIPALLLDAPVDRQELPRLFSDRSALDALVEHAVHLHQVDGFTAFKQKCTGTSPEWDVALLQALRAALGPEVKLRWDPNASYPPAQATVLCQQLEDIGLEYYEDPIHGIAGMAQLRTRMTTPLATNMCVVNFDHLATALRQPCVDVVLADLVMWGGVQSMAELGDVTPLFGLDLTIHSAFELGLGMAANLQVAAAVDPVRRAIDYGLENMEDELITPTLTVRDGRVILPDGPGLGVDPDWDAIARCRTDTTIIE